jgi:hypothetical protein
VESAESKQKGANSGKQIAKKKATDSRPQNLPKSLESFGITWNQQNLGILEEAVSLLP